MTNSTKNAVLSTLPVSNPCLDADDLRRNIPAFHVGDLVTEYFYTDAHAGRVIDIRRNGKEIVVQEDKATKDPNWKPNIIEGGFAGHCTNGRELTYTYEADPNGSISAYTLRTWRGVKVWTRKGNDPNGRNQIGHGQHKYYDQNF
jgi:hypothetical protein